MLAAPEAATAVDLVLASPLPEALGRSLAEHHVVERVVAEVLASADLERAITSALESERTSKLAEQVLSSPALARMLNEALESKLTAELAEKVVSSPEFDRMLEQAVSSPAVRAALARQTQSLGQDTAAGLRRRAVRVDDAAERAPRRWLRQAAAPRRSRAQAGIGTRGIALAIDALIAQLIFLTIAATFGLIGSLVGGPDSNSVLGALAGAGWAIVVGAYFLDFWSGAGPDAGDAADGPARCSTRPAPRRASGARSLRLFGLGIAIAIAFLGFVPVLVDDRRRALQDFLAGTAVYYDELAPLPEDDAVAAVAARLAPTTVAACAGSTPGCSQRARPARLLLRVDAAIGVAMALLVLAQAVLLARVAARGVRRRVARATSRRRSCCSPPSSSRARRRSRGASRSPAGAPPRACSRSCGSTSSSSGCATQPAALDGAESAEVATAAVAGVDALETIFARYLPQLVLALVVPVAVLIARRLDRPARGRA